MRRQIDTDVAPRDRMVMHERTITLYQPIVFCCRCGSTREAE